MFGSDKPAKTSLAERLDRPLIDFNVTSYGPKEGAPSYIKTIDQTPDGFLWLGSSEGLFRFDGVTFDKSVSRNLPQQDISTIVVDREGALWIGYQFGGVSRLSHGQVTNFDRGIPKGRTVSSLAIDSSGTVWADTTVGLYRLSGGDWKNVGAKDGFTGASPSSASEGQFVQIQHDGTLWIASRSGKSWYLSPGAKVFQVGKAQTYLESNFGLKFADMPPDVQQTLSALIATNQALNPTSTWDAAGSFWSVFRPELTRWRWTTVQNGRRQLVVETLQRQGPSYGSITAVSFADKEGNLWLGEVGGLERLRPNKLHVLKPPNGLLSPSIAKGTNGDIWVGAYQSGNVYQVKGTSTVIWPQLGPSTSIIRADHKGNVWFLGNHYGVNSGSDSYVIRRLTDNQISRIFYPSMSLRSPVDFVEDPRGGYLMTSGAGVFHLENDAWTLGFGRAGLPADPPFRLTLDDARRVWMAYSGNRVSVIDGARIRNYTSTNGLSLGNIFALSVKNGHVWVAGENGVEHLVGDRFVPLMPDGSATFQGASGVVETQRGELWINADAGLFRIKKDELDRVLSGDLGHTVKQNLFDSSDGLQGGSIQLAPGPTLLEGDDERIWAARLGGAAWIDPADIPWNEVPPHVVISAVAADGTVTDPDQPVRLPPLVRNLRFDYTAPSLSMPEKVTFAYRLDGVDRDWQEAGNRRQAFYTNLQPGNYTFRVRATNEDGVPSAEDALVNFRIAPAFYQTWSFRLLCLLLLMFFAWLLYELRIRQIQGRLRLQLEAKHAERERIARELHDTLMQSMHGLVLQVQSWSGNKAIADSHRTDMAKAAVLAKQMLAEGRDHILALRTSSKEFVDLAAGFREIGPQYMPLHPSSFSVTQVNCPRRLKADAIEEVFAIGHEGIRNAFIHAMARHIDVSVSYLQSGLILLVRDDGVGIDREILRTGGKVGHWGMVGMRERAARLHATLSIDGISSGGTQICLRVPAGDIYVTRWSLLNSMIRKSPLIDDESR